MLRSGLPDATLENLSEVILLSDGISQLTFEGFNHQNVIGALTLEPSQGLLAVAIHSVHGIGGGFTCRAANVLRVTPWVAPPTP